jgi:CDP-diglyceride synthetase
MDNPCLRLGRGIVNMETKRKDKRMKDFLKKTGLGFAFFLLIAYLGTELVVQLLAIKKATEGYYIEVNFIQENWHAIPIYLLLIGLVVLIFYSIGDSFLKD